MYYKTTDSEVIRVMNEVLESKTNYRRRAFELAKEFGAEKAWFYTGGRLAGFSFVGDIPENWRKPDRQGITMPKVKNKTATEKIKTLPKILRIDLIADTIGFQMQFGPKPPGGLASMITCPACFTVGDTAYFDIDNDLEFKRPEHFIEILGSEYEQAHERLNEASG